jgi:hypothetical protein
LTNLVLSEPFITYRVPEDRKPLGRPGSRWDYIKIDLKEQDGKLWTGLIGLRTKDLCGLL